MISILFLNNRILITLCELIIFFTIGVEKGAKFKFNQFVKNMNLIYSDLLDLSILKKY